MIYVQTLGILSVYIVLIHNGLQITGGGSPSPLPHFFSPGCRISESAMLPLPHIVLLVNKSSLFRSRCSDGADFFLLFEEDMFVHWREKTSR